MTFTAELDARFGETDAPADWATVAAALTSAELYWLTTVRDDGRPHVTPLVGLWSDDAFVFCTGPEEQKARNLAHGQDVAVTTGTNTWKSGLDVVVEGRAERVTDVGDITALADVYREKYRGDWDFTPGADGFGHGDNLAHVFRVVPQKVLAFAKAPHGQTRFRP
jgi:pyridoxamine 5'-phosphate oxidase-like protein